MNAWNRHLGEYLELRHRLGFKLRNASSELRKFVCFGQRRLKVTDDDYQFSGGLG